jgi:predicted phosphate transport protein (TIGR00153 family)
MKNNIFSYFIPKEVKFFPLFIQLSEVIKTAADVLIKCTQTASHEEHSEYYKQIKDYERLGDKLSHQIFDELNRTFITPFDREDIHELAMFMDDVLDGINSSAKRLALYKPKIIPESAEQLAVLIRQAAECLGVITTELETVKKKTEKVKALCAELHDIENKADDVYDFFVKKLFEEEKDSLELIKLKEILYEMEKTTDIVEYVGKIVTTIIVKYA